MKKAQTENERFLEYPQKLIMKWKYKHCNELLVNWWNPVMWSITFHSSKNTFSRINFNISLSNPFIIHVGRLSFYQLQSECSIGISCIYSYGADSCTYASASHMLLEFHFNIRHEFYHQKQKENQYHFFINFYILDVHMYDWNLLI